MNLNAEWDALFQRMAPILILYKTHFPKQKLKYNIKEIVVDDVRTLGNYL